MNDPKQGFGVRLRALRKSKGFTLADLAALTDVSVSTISKAENGAISPTYDVILRLCKGLDVSVAQLVADDDGGPSEDPTPRGRFAVSRHGQAVKIDTRSYDYYYLCTGLKKKTMVPILARIKSHSVQEFGTLLTHAGEEFLFVLKGTVEVHTDYYQTETLSVGEGVYLDSTMAHGYVATGDEEVEVLCVCTSPQPVPDQEPNE